jgi:proliferating cell nuclear antigen
MFKAVTDDTRLLKDSIETISQLIDDGIFKLTKNGIELLAADRAIVSVVDFKLKSTAFDEYVCDEKKEIGINLLSFLTFLKRSSSLDKMTLELNERENKLEIYLEGESNRKFAIPLIEVSKREMPEIEKLEFTASAEIKSTVLEQGINDADLVADSVIFDISEKGIKMFAKGNGSKTELVLEGGNEALLKLNAKERVDSRYSLEYLKKIIKGARLSDKTQISIGKDFPMKLQFIGENASLSMILAPRVSED